MDDSEDTRAAWAAEIRAQRARLDLTQAQLAERAGVARQTVNLIESGRGNRAMFLAVAGALGLDLLAVEVDG